MRTTVTVYLAPSSRRVKFSHSTSTESNDELPSVGRRVIAVSAALLVFLISSILYQTLVSPRTAANTVYISNVNSPSVTAQLDDTDILSAASRIKVIRFTKAVMAGDTATLKIQGEPNTLYSITLYLSNSVSTSSALMPKRSDRKGMVEWSWRVSDSTSAGSYRLTVCSYLSDSNRVRRLTSYSQLQLKVLSNSSE